MSCNECGSKIPPNYVVCDICGEPVTKDPSASTSKAAPRQDHPGYEVATKKKDTESDGADPAETVWCSVLGKDGACRAVILFDGAVCLNDGTTIGFINQRNQVADSEGRLLGYVLGDQVCSAAESEVGSLNRGIGTIHDTLGSTLLDLDGIGCCRGHTSVILGQFAGLSYRELPQIALYVLFLDPDFLDESADNVTREPRIEEVKKKPVQSAVTGGKKLEFVKSSTLGSASNADKVTLELVAGKDVATMDFAARMALWATQEQRVSVRAAADAGSPSRTSQVARQCGQCGNSSIAPGRKACNVCGENI